MWELNQPWIWPLARVSRFPSFPTSPNSTILRKGNLVCEDRLWDSIRLTVCLCNIKHNPTQFHPLLGVRVLGNFHGEPDFSLSRSSFLECMMPPDTWKTNTILTVKLIREWNISLFERGSHIPWAGLSLTMKLRMIWNIWSSYLLLSAEMAGVSLPHLIIFKVVLGIKSRVCCKLRQDFINVLYPPLESE